MTKDIKDQTEVSKDTRTKTRKAIDGALNLLDYEVRGQMSSMDWRLKRHYTPLPRLQYTPIP